MKFSSNLIVKSFLESNRTLQFLTYRSGLCRAGEVCCRIPKTTPPPFTLKPKPQSVFSTFLRPVHYEKCGKRGGRIEKRILIDFGSDSVESEEEDVEVIGESAFGEFPWMIEIQKWNRSIGEFQYQCGGVLINPSTALTVTHCVKSVLKFTNLKIRAGEWDRATTNEYLPHQDRIVSRVIHHPQYYSGGLYNDISIIKWNEPLDMTLANVQSICLPDEYDDFEGQTCTASGWGKDRFVNGKNSQILKYVDLPIVESRKCEKQLQDIRFGRRFRLHDSFICAGGDANSDTCEGKIFKIHKNLQFYSIVSFLKVMEEVRWFAKRTACIHWLDWSAGA